MLREAVDEGDFDRCCSSGYREVPPAELVIIRVGRGVPMMLCESSEPVVFLSG